MTAAIPAIDYRHIKRRGTLVGIPWLGYPCGHCRYCKRGQENLCERANEALSGKINGAAVLVMPA